MTENFAAVIGLLFGSYGLGWAIGRWTKAVRQFFDSL